MPGFETGRAIYNWDSLYGREVVVLCEGVTDAWSVGPGCGALFGKVLKDGQAQLLQSLAPRQPLVVLFLDRDAREEAEKARAKLADAFPGRVMVVSPPEEAVREDCRC